VSLHGVRVRTWDRKKVPGEGRGPIMAAMVVKGGGLGVGLGTTAKDTVASSGLLFLEASGDEGEEAARFPAIGMDKFGIAVGLAGVDDGGSSSEGEEGED